MAVTWSELSYDLLVEIAKRIDLYDDFVAFGSVCTSWAVAAVEENFQYASSQIPWLMLPRKPCDNTYCFFSVSTGKSRQVFLPEASGKRCLSSKGWLITISQDWSMNLLHPFSRVQIKLPHLKKFKDWDDLSTPNNGVLFISKCTLSASPSSKSDYILMVVHGHLGKLGYYRPGDKAWTTIDEWQGCYLDVAYYKGQFYAINCQAKIMACDFRGDGPATARVVATPPHEFERCLNQVYLLESAGALLAVTKSIKEEWPNSKKKFSYQTYKFRVFEVDLSTNTWTEIKNLGNRSLFLGYNSSLSLEALNSHPNFIYFTDDFRDGYWFQFKGGGKDMGIYNLDDGTVHPHFWGNSTSRINPPFWV